jgi:hypothetical protein
LGRGGVSTLLRQRPLIRVVPRRGGRVSGALVADWCFRDLTAARLRSVWKYSAAKCGAAVEPQLRARLRRSSTCFVTELRGRPPPVRGVGWCRVRHVGARRRCALYRDTTVPYGPLCSGLWDARAARGDAYSTDWRRLGLGGGQPSPCGRSARIGAGRGWFCLAEAEPALVRRRRTERHTGYESVASRDGYALPCNDALRRPRAWERLCSVVAGAAQKARSMLRGWGARCLEPLLHVHCRVVASWPYCISTATAFLCLGSSL